jgi:hypothetical protein
VPWGRNSLPQKTRMAVSSPAAAALPRISAFLHDSADPQPDVAAHPSRTEMLRKSPYRMAARAIFDRGPEALGRVHQALGSSVAAGEGTGSAFFRRGRIVAAGVEACPGTSSTRSRSVSCARARYPAVLRDAGGRRICSPVIDRGRCAPAPPVTDRVPSNSRRSLPEGAAGGTVPCRMAAGDRRICSAVIDRRGYAPAPPVTDRVPSNSRRCLPEGAARGTVPCRMAAGDRRI